MAVLSTLPGVIVGILVNRRRAREYDDNEEKIAPKTITKYIKAVTGSALAIQIFVDGVIVRSPVLRGETSGQYIGGIIDGVISFDDAKKEATLQKFYFAEIINSDAIEVAQSQPLRAPPQLVHEKSQKGGTKFHGVALKDPEPTHFRFKHESNMVDGNESPIGIYVFKYRSKAGLQSPLVIKDDFAAADVSESSSQVPVSIGERSVNPANTEQGISPQIKPKKKSRVHDAQVHVLVDVKQKVSEGSPIFDDELAAKRRKLAKKEVSEVSGKNFVDITLDDE